MPTIEAGSRGKCPHCGVTVQFETARYFGNQVTLKNISVRAAGQVFTMTPCGCPACGQIVVTGEVLAQSEYDGDVHYVPCSEGVMWPIGHSREKPAAEVPPHIARDYNEAARILMLSPKASAALSRRVLQTVLREAAQTQEKDLAKQIDEVIGRGTLPSYITEQIDAIRNHGNFAAHPIKSTHTGEIVDVEPHEAEWNLDVLDSLFDFYYVQPGLAKAKKDALNAKLRSAGKPEMK